jgi:hypothetical protein
MRLVLNLAVVREDQVHVVRRLPLDAPNHLLSPLSPQPPAGGRLGA